MFQFPPAPLEVTRIHCDLQGCMGEGVPAKAAAIYTLYGGNICHNLFLQALLRVAVNSGDLQRCCWMLLRRCEEVVQKQHGSKTAALPLLFCSSQFHKSTWGTGFISPPNPNPIPHICLCYILRMLVDHSFVRQIADSQQGEICLR